MATEGSGQKELASVIKEAKALRAPYSQEYVSKVSELIASNLTQISAFLTKFVLIEE